jgi:probable rRNA maturation factor
MILNIQNKTDFNIGGLEAVITDAVRETLKAEATASGAEINVVVVCDEEMKALNHEYRGADTVTDCLSFPFDAHMKKQRKIPGRHKSYIPMGDIIICIRQAERQAKEYGHSLEREVGFLAVHSTLHLLGFTHETAEDESEMCAKQEKILSGLNLTR